MRAIGWAWAVAALFAAAAAGDVIYVKSDAVGSNDGSSWADAFVSLQDALAAAQLGDEIWVAAGVYRPDQGAAQTPGDRTAFFQVRTDTAAALYGGFDGTEATLEDRAGLFEQTILDGDLNGDDTPGFGNRGDNAERILINWSAAALDGFTLRGSFGQVALELFVDDALIRHCAFLENRGYDYSGPDYGGGALRTRGDNATVEHCRFVGNKSFVGAATYVYSGAAFRDCRFESNRADFGGAVYVDYGAARFERSVFLSNHAAYVGGAIRSVSGSSGFVMQDYRFLGNTAEMGYYEGYGGGAICARTAPRIVAVNCEFSGNRTRAAGYENGGGAIVMLAARRAIFANCTFSENSSRSWGGAVIVWSSRNPASPALRMYNCILVGNRARLGSGPAIQALGVNEYTTPTLAVNCCIEGYSGEFDGEGNIDADPMFVDTDGADNIVGTEDDDLRLAANSPCIDAGANASAIDWIDIDGDGDREEPLLLDLLGRPRFQDDPNVPDSGSGTPPIVDMGPYEGGEQALLAEAHRLDVVEGSTATAHFRLARRPAADVVAVVATTGGDAGFSVVGGHTLVFTRDNWNQPHAVSVALAADADWFNESGMLQVDGGAWTRNVQLRGADADPYPEIVHVRSGGTGFGTNWADAAGNLQGALEAVRARPGPREIWVAAGAYAPAAVGGDRVASFALQSGVALRGGFAGHETSLDQRRIRDNPTVLTGDLNGDDLPGFENREDNSTSVVTALDVDASGILDGFIVRGGSSLRSVSGAATGPDELLSGGGIHVTGGAPTIVNCRFLDHTSEEGGAVTLSDTRAALVSCVIDNNVDLFGAGGVLVAQFDEVQSAAPRIIQCTVTNNESMNRNAGGLNTAAGTQVVSTIVAGNFGLNHDDPHAQVDGDGEYSHCIIGDRPGGPNLSGYACFGANPQFVDADGPDDIPGTLDDDYRLRAGSPAIDAGCSNALGRDRADVDGDGNTDELIPLDVDGNPRIADDPATPDAGCGALGVVDIGAYEFAGTPAGGCFGDLDGDGAVALPDIQQVVSAYGADPQDPRWDCAADMTCDGSVDFEDLAILLSLYGAACP